MTPERKRCECCHEAGHAVSGVINEDELLLVVGYAGAAMTDAQREVYERWLPRTEVRAATLSARRQHKCGCGGNVQCDVLSKRRFHWGNPDCQSCLEFVIREVATVRAGGTAVRLLMPEEHNPFRSKGDGRDENTFLADLTEKQRVDGGRQTKILAEKWMREESEAVLALAGVLEERVLGGPEAERIVKQSLRGPSGQLTRGSTKLLPG